MEKYDMTAFAQLMTGLGELYGKAISEPLIEIYWSTLKRFDLERIQTAANTHVKHPENGRFMPKPSDFVSIIEGTTQARAMHAWSKVLLAIRQIGQYDSLVFDDCLIHAVIQDMGGWIQLCQGQSKDIAFRATEFEKRYSHYLVTPPKSYPQKLVGMMEATKGSPHCSYEPVLFGDEIQALQVYRQGLPLYQLFPVKLLSDKHLKRLAVQDPNQPQHSMDYLNYVEPDQEDQ